MFLKEITLLLFILVSTSAISKCPPAGTLIHCSCKQDVTFGPMFECLNGTLQHLNHDLEFISKAKMQINYITIINPTLEFLQPRLFGNSLVSNAIFQIPNAKNVSHLTFVGQENCLERIEMVNTRFASVPNAALRIISKLRILEISNSSAFAKSLNKHDFANFSNPDHLQFITLKYNGLNSIESGTFEYFKNLNSLSLSYNKLTTIDPNIFYHGKGVLSMFWLELK